MTNLREASIRAIQDYGWYHSCEVLPGFMSPRRNVTNAANIFDQRHKLPQRLSGLRALDVGALDGPYIFELECRDAEITALDIQSSDVLGFDIARRARKSNVHYVQRGVYHLSEILKGGKFDIITYFGVWYHFEHPIIALEHIWNALTDLSVPGVSACAAISNRRRPIAFASTRPAPPSSARARRLTRFSMRTNTRATNGAGTCRTRRA